MAAKTNIKFMVKLGWRNEEFIDVLCKAYKESPPKKSDVYEGTACFKKRWEDVEDESCSGYEHHCAQISLHLGGRGCSESTSCHCTPARATWGKLCPIEKKKKTHINPIQYYLKKKKKKEGKCVICNMNERRRCYTKWNNAEAGHGGSCL